MIKWTIVLSLGALACTFIGGYLLELRHLHSPLEPEPEHEPEPEPEPEPKPEPKPKPTPSPSLTPALPRP